MGVDGHIAQYISSESRSCSLISGWDQRTLFVRKGLFWE